MYARHTPEPMIRATLDPTKPMDAVNAQLEILGDDHIGFSSKSVPNKSVTIVGARPFAGVSFASYDTLMDAIFREQVIDIQRS